MRWGTFWLWSLWKTEKRGARLLESFQERPEQLGLDRGHSSLLQSTSHEYPVPTTIWSFQAIGLQLTTISPRIRSLLPFLFWNIFLLANQYCATAGRVLHNCWFKGDMPKVIRWCYHSADQSCSSLGQGPDRAITGGNLMFSRLYPKYSFNLVHNFIRQMFEATPRRRAWVRILVQVICWESTLRGKPEGREGSEIGQGGSRVKMRLQEMSSTQSDCEWHYRSVLAWGLG